jgi:hypothetical protein
LDSNASPLIARLSLLKHTGGIGACKKKAREASLPGLRDHADEVLADPEKPLHSPFGAGSFQIIDPSLPERAMLQVEELEAIVAQKRPDPMMRECMGMTGVKPQSREDSMKIVADSASRVDGKVKVTARSQSATQF